MDLTPRRLRELVELEATLHMFKRVWPLGAGESPEFIPDLDHVDPFLRSGSRRYVREVAALRTGRLL